MYIALMVVLIMAYSLFCHDFDCYFCEYFSCHQICRSVHFISIQAHLRCFFSNSEHSAELIEIYRSRHDITVSTSTNLSDPAVATGISDLIYESNTTPAQPDGLDDDLVNAWAANLGDDLLGKNTPAMTRVRTCFFVSFYPSVLAVMR